MPRAGSAGRCVLRPRKAIRRSVCLRPPSCLLAGYNRQVKFKYGERVDPPLRPASGLCTPEYQRSIGPAETERIGQHDVNLALAWRVRHEVDWRLHRRLVQIDGRW